MPCRSDYMEPSPKELAATALVRKTVEILGDDVTHHCDVLREYLLGNIPAEEAMKYVNKSFGDQYVDLRKANDKLYQKVDSSTMALVNGLVTGYDTLNNLIMLVGKDNLSESEIESLTQAQVEHREEDLRRLMKTFAETGDRVRLKKVLDADNTKPLAPQLGFDPDAF